MGTLTQPCGHSRSQRSAPQTSLPRGSTEAFTGPGERFPEGQAPAPTGAQGDRARGPCLAPHPPQHAQDQGQWLGNAPGPPQAPLGQEWHRQGQKLLAQGTEQHSEGQARAHQPQPREAFPGWPGATHTAANLWGCQKNSKDTSEHASGKHSRTKALLFNSKFFSSPGPLWPLGTSCPWPHAASSSAAPRRGLGWALLPWPTAGREPEEESKGGRCKGRISALTAHRLTQQCCFDSGKRRPAAPWVLFTPSTGRDGIQRHLQSTTDLVSLSHSLETATL